MPAPGRTTVSTALSTLRGSLRANLVADPPTPSAPFREVAMEPAEETDCVRPFLAVYLDQTELLGLVDDDRVVEVTMKLHLVADVSTVDSHEELLALIGAVDDYFDEIRDSGVVNGAEGFEKRVWSFSFAKLTAGARTAGATAKQTFIVKIEREQNLG